jgi:hypothetical protein
MMNTPRALTKPSRKPAKRRSFRASDLAAESDIQRTITECLQLDGWRAIRTDPVSDRARGKGFGEVGMPDHLYLRYGLPSLRRNFSGHPPEIQSSGQILWIEFKRPGQSPTPAQLGWHAVERERGALVLVVGTEPTWWEDFKAWYAGSGLQRR